MEKINVYFNYALNQAKDLFGNKDKMISLVDNAFKKITRVEGNNDEIKGLVNKVKMFIRMIRAYIEGEYREIPWKSMTIILASLIYFVNPFDLVPDFIPGIGFIDDISIILMVFKSVEQDVIKFQDEYYSSSL
jgi:uncharacterized membrane protein YkvA (DUF1232 family)